jgi:hypothetical protein
MLSFQQDDSLVLLMVEFDVQRPQVSVKPGVLDRNNALSISEA